MTEQTKYTPGSIKLMKLSNFMCHESFEQSFGPKVNFIIGKNGSGKSALLTALIVALGGRATVTSRAKKTSDFIMYGKKYAKITVILHNFDKVMDRGLAFKPDDYGKEIIIEKEIWPDKMNLTLRNKDKKKVSERKAELDEMLEHFSILINNPICILNQEVSKTFLHSKKPEDTFDLFMKATNLENIEDDYNSAKDSYNKWDDVNKRGTTGFKLLDAEYARCLEKTKALEDRNKLHQQKADLTFELIWARIFNNEDVAKKLKNQIELCRNEISDAEKAIELKESKVKKFGEEEQQLKTEYESSHTRLVKINEKIDEIVKQEEGVKLKRINKEIEVNKCRKQIDRLNVEKQNMEKSIADTKRLLREQNALDQDEEKRKSEIEFIQKDIDHLRAREISLDNEIRQLSGSMSESMNEQIQAQSHLSDLQIKKNQSEAYLKRLQNGQGNALRKYGDHYIKLLERIEEHHKRHQGPNDPQKFSAKPVGPLGYHIRLRSADIAQPLEIHLGRNAHAFVVNNSRDMSILHRIFDEVLTNFGGRPMIIVRPFTRRHDISAHATTHSEFKTMIDYLEIENDAIFNVCVDRCQMENILYIPDYKVAQHMLLNQSLVPPKLRCAYTADSTMMYPVTSNGGYRYYSNDTSRLVLFKESDQNSIRKEEKQVEILKAEVRNAEVRYNKLKESCQIQKKAYTEATEERRRVVDQLRQKDKKLSELKLIIPTAEPTELKGLEEDLDECSKNIAELQLRYDIVFQELSDIDKELNDSKGDRESLLATKRQREDAKKQFNSQLEKTKENIDEAKRMIKNEGEKINHRQRDITKYSEDLNHYYIEVEQGIAAAPKDRPRPTSTRSIEAITDAKQELEAKIKVLEDNEMDPEDVLRNLKRRMQEIKDMTNLKDSNLSNAQLMSSSLEDREIGFVNLKKTTINAVSTTFSKVMRSMNMNGILKIYMDPIEERGQVIKKGKTLEMSIDTNYLPTSQYVNSVSAGGDTGVNERSYQSQPDKTPSRAKRARLDPEISGKENEPILKNMTNTRSLSGGERSFSTVAFVLSLWQHCVSPFKLMDEIDVFMDMVTRRTSYNALIQFAQYSKPGQFIFFSPLDLPKIDAPLEMVRVFHMNDPKRKDQSSIPEAVES